MAVPIPAEIPQLEAYRLAADLTWEGLAARMRERYEIRMSARTLHYLVHSMPPGAVLRELTIYKLRRFLSAERERADRLQQERRRRRQRAAGKPVGKRQRGLA